MSFELKTIEDLEEGTYQVIEETKSKTEITKVVWRREVLEIEIQKLTDTITELETRKTILDEQLARLPKEIK